MYEFWEDRSYSTHDKHSGASNYLYLALYLCICLNPAIFLSINCLCIYLHRRLESNPEKTSGARVNFSACSGLSGHTSMLLCPLYVFLPLCVCMVKIKMGLQLFLSIFQSKCTTELTDIFPSQTPGREDSLIQIGSTQLHQVGVKMCTSE